jgi:plastocyanin
MRQLVLVLVAAAVTACGGSSATGTTGTTTTTPPVTDTPTATTSVVIQNIAFTPASIVVSSGSVVTFTNNDNITHNVTFANTSVGTSGNFSSGVKSLTMPATAGVYTYKCTIHGSMTGTVTVQ